MTRLVPAGRSDPEHPERPNPTSVIAAPIATAAATGRRALP
ncbi:hypothetical protein [Actinospica robiniae]|nr:hypothetical protein [Actinospica robiniae]